MLYKVKKASIQERTVTATQQGTETVGGEREKQPYENNS